MLLEILQSNFVDYNFNVELLENILRRFLFESHLTITDGDFWFFMEIIR